MEKDKLEIMWVTKGFKKIMKTEAINSDKTMADLCRELEKRADPLSHITEKYKKRKQEFDFP